MASAAAAKQDDDDDDCARYKRRESCDACDARASLLFSAVFRVQPKPCITVCNQPPMG